MNFASPTDSLSLVTTTWSAPRSAAAPICVILTVGFGTGVSRTARNIYSRAVRQQILRHRQVIGDYGIGERRRSGFEMARIHIGAVRHQQFGHLAAAGRGTAR